MTILLRWVGIGLALGFAFLLSKPTWASVVLIYIAIALAFMEGWSASRAWPRSPR